MQTENEIERTHTMIDTLIRPTPRQIKFEADEGFYPELRRRVDQYFRDTGKGQRDCPRMYLKTAITLAWVVASYVLLVVVGGPWWLALLSAVSLGLAMSAVGFNVQHDGGHAAYSDHPWVNKLMASSLDLLGGSSYIWARKHNVIHHSFTNISDHDDDINIGVFGRLSPHQPRRRFHRFQHLYLWPLYGILPVKWQYFDDFYNVIIGKIGEHRIPRPKGWALAGLLAGKVAFLTFALVIPLMLHSVWLVIAYYALVSLVQGVALSVVFQMAHCVEEASFPLPREGSYRMDNAWAVHQVETTVDFARNSWLVCWFVGGLNFQIEHHLFPRICHLHYPALSSIVEQTCREYGVRYAAHDTFWGGVASHFRWLRRMGMAGTA